ncbi:uncharacterized protein LOC142236970 [Haematobia irritans]
MKLYMRILFLIVVGISICDACDPNGDGKPQCSLLSFGKTYRNFWDPTAFWICNFMGKAELLRCPISTLYDSESKRCIPSSQWVWTPPCGDN